MVLAMQVYFHWVVRDSPSLAYFRDTLETIAQDDVRSQYLLHCPRSSC